MSGSIRVLLADDHPIVRHGLKLLLRAYLDIEIVGEAAHGEEAIRKVAELQPDVVIMDLKMPGKDGVAATREILQRNPQTRILVLTSFAEDEKVVEAIRAGARGFLLKDAETEQVVEGIYTLHRGGRILDPAVAGKLMQTVEQRVQASLPIEPLTPRELEVLRLVAVGRSNREIAAELDLALPTVTSHVRNILGKLQVANRTQAAIYARDKHLI